MSNIITTQGNGFAPATIDEAMRLADTLSRSSMVPRAYQGKPEDILVATIWGKEIGLATLQALQNIAVINGKPSVYGDAAMALVQASPVCEDVEEYFEAEGTPNPVAVCVAKRKGRKPVVAKFSVEDAKRAGLWGKQGPWSAYPKRMMQMRARGFALRDAFPDVLKGLITAEEAQDYPDEAKPKQARDITPRNPLDLVAKPAIEATSERAEIEDLMADTVDAVVMPGTEVVDIPEVTEATETVAETQQPEPVAEMSESVPSEDDKSWVPEPMVVGDGFAVFVPGKTTPTSVHASLDDWQDAYEDMADRIAKAGKRSARERMTILREFKDVNEETIKRVDMVKRIRHTANYQKRLKALGAAQ
jgi:hypothetical protein